MPQYTGIVLLPDEQQYLLTILNSLYGQFKYSGFVNRNAQGKLLCHHMTCNLGSVKEEHKAYLGREFQVTLDAWGATDKAMALRVSQVAPTGVSSCNATPHITALVNPSAGGSPKDSNAITAWHYLQKPLTVVGVFQEV